MPARPAITGQISGFPARRSQGNAAALYILGDLFESWIGDDAPDAAQSRGHRRTARADRRAASPASSCTAIGISCCRAQFCRMSGARLLPDPLIVTLYGEPVLVMHGDALCTDDRPYQRLRATVRDPDWQRQFLALSDRIAPRARRRRARRQPGAYRRHGTRDHRRQCRQRRCGAADRRHRHAAARPYASAGHPRLAKSMAGRAPASCWATGTIRAACCAGTTGDRSWRR